MLKVLPPIPLGARSLPTVVASEYPLLPSVQFSQMSPEGRGAPDRDSEYSQVCDIKSS
jgi:hypothetical protein